MKWIKDMLAGPNGQASSQRTCLLAVIALLLAWSTRIVILTTTIPAIPETWVWLLGVLISGIGIGTGAETYKTVKTAEPPQ